MSLLRQFANVGSRDESLFTRASHDDYADAGIILNVMKCRAQFFHSRHVERVQDFGTIDGDVGDSAFFFEKNVFKVHKFRNLRLIHSGLSF